MYIDRKGTTRTVILIGGYALKLPTIGSGLHLFLRGLLANLDEGTWCRRSIPDEPGLPDVIWVAPLGLLSIQRRLRPVSNRGMFWVNLQELISTSKLHKDFWEYDAKPENFAYRGTQLVKIDVSC